MTQEEAGPLELFKTAAKPQLLWRFLQLGMPGAVMMTADASSFDITTAMAGILSMSLALYLLCIARLAIGLRRRC